MTDNTCGTCKWWRGNTRKWMGKPGDGHCHRHPPQVTALINNQRVSSWPLVDAIDFCGEHQPKKESGDGS